jgi:glycosyltransferase involved in cell wall biosynthesis
MMVVNVADDTDTRDESALPRPNLVSVIISCLNQAQFLREAIESVLAQSYPKIDIILVGDGSTGDTAEIAKRYSSAQHIHQENAGLSRTRNAGVGHSRGEFLLFLDADDRLLPRAVEIAVGCMHEHPECAFVSGRSRAISSSGEPVPSPEQPRVEREHYLELLRGSNYIQCPGSVLYQRRIFDFVHGFDPLLDAAGDYDLYLRITKDFSVHCHDEVVTECRQRHLNVSRDVAATERAVLAAHAAQWDFVKANSRYREAYEVGRHFWKDEYPFQQMVNRIRKIVREQLPPDAIVAVATGGNSELLRLDTRQAWHFPQTEANDAGQLFAEGAEGSASTDAWIETGTTYQFTLYGGKACSKLLARLLVRGIPDSGPPTSARSEQEQPASGDGILLIANPNPVPAGERPGATNISWSTGDGSHGRVYVLSGFGAYAGHDPSDGDEAWNSLEATRAHGAQYLIIPAKSFWWLNRYRKFRERVEARYPIIVRDENTCIIFDLR